jgi:hypothetical protein
VTGYEPSTPLRLDAGAPRPVQRPQQRAPQRQPRQGKTSGSARPNGYAPQGRSDHAAGNQRRRSNPRPAAKA